MTTTLPDRISNARKALTTIETLGDALNVADQAAAAQVWARRANLGLDAQNEAAEIKILAERTAGSILKAMRENGERIGNDGASKSSSRASLDSLGVSKKESSRWQQLAEIPEDEIVEEISKTKKAGEEVTTAALVKRKQRKQREGKLRDERELATAEARDEIADDDSALSIEVADVRTWRPEGVAAIITDPPYVGDAIPLYAALADFALDVLPEGGPLVVMTWQAILAEVFHAMRRPGLAYRWCIEWRYANAANTVDQKRRVFDCWKPILVFHKGAMPADAPVIRDSIESRGTDKDFHEWGQGLDGFERLVKSFSRPGDIVCDPFLGGGTTAVAALAQTRRFAGCDIDASAVATTMQRLQLKVAA